MPVAASPDPLSRLRATVEEAAAALRGEDDGGRAAPTLERPPKPEFGDYSTNAAMLLAPVARASRRARSPSAWARSSRGALGERLERVEVAGPGFLNLFLADAWFRDALAPSWRRARASAAASPAAPERDPRRVRVAPTRRAR